MSLNAVVVGGALRHRYRGVFGACRSLFIASLTRAMMLGAQWFCRKACQFTFNISTSTPTRLRHGCGSFRLCNLTVLAR